MRVLIIGCGYVGLPLGAELARLEHEVYGQTDGSMVKESSPAEPSGELGQVLVATERLLLEAARAKKIPAVILRAAGIYGPGRRVVRTFFGGSAPLAVAALLDASDTELSTQDIDQLQAIINQARKEGR